jgi:hypothetical protein
MINERFANEPLGVFLPFGLELAPPPPLRAPSPIRTSTFADRALICLIPRVRLLVLQGRLHCLLRCAPTPDQVLSLNFVCAEGPGSLTILRLCQPRRIRSTAPESTGAIDISSLVPLH